MPVPVALLGDKGTVKVHETISSSRPQPAVCKGELAIQTWKRNRALGSRQEPRKHGLMNFRHGLQSCWPDRG